MILQKSKNISLSFSPFQAYQTKDNKLRFSKGFIFNIFQDFPNKDGNESDVALKESCNFCRPLNMNEDFSYGKGDKFYLSIDRNFIKNSKLIKVAASESLPITSREKDYILICAINGSGNINQILRQNVFIQDRSFATKKAFQVNQISAEVNGRGEITSKKYKMEGGFAVCLASGKVLFVEGIDEFEVQGEKLLLEKEEPEKIIYLVAEYSTKVTTNDAYVPYKVITSATFKDAYLEIEEKERDLDSIYEEAPKTGKKGNKTNGKFYIPIYPLRPYGLNAQPKEGNVYLSPYINRTQVLISDEFFFGPDGGVAFLQEETLEDGSPVVYYIWLSQDASPDELSRGDIVAALFDEDYDGPVPIDVGHSQEKYSVLRLRV